MVDLVVNHIPPVQNDPNRRNEQERPSPGKGKKMRERRKNSVDRRQSVRDGIVVTLSTHVDRRQQPDRRKG